MDWEPISKPALQARVAEGVGRMTIAQLRLWNAIEVEPVKWLQHPPSPSYRLGDPADPQRFPRP